MQYEFYYHNPNTHFINIRFQLDNPAKAVTRLYLPAWRPGRYQKADFAKNVQQWQPYDGQGNPLSFQKVAKDCWEVITDQIETLTVEYNYFAFKLDAGNTYLDDDQLYINPVNCCLYDPDRIEENCRIALHLPTDYEVATALKRAGKNTFQAKGFQELADSPLIATDGLKHDLLEVAGYKFRLWFKGECDPDFDRIKKDFSAFIQKQINTFGEFPVDTYHFFFQLPSYSHFHGVEQENSTVISLGPGYKLMQPDLYNRFIAVSSHELYHTWNIKAIRPYEMTPYRFNEENYSHLGYMAEGVTTYYGDLFLLRSQVFDFDQYKAQFDKVALRHFHNYGRFYSSVAASSFDTWLDGYQNDVPDRKVSIYIKGMMVALLMDVQILKDTGNKYGLDEVMRQLYYHYAKNGTGYTEANLKSLIETLTEQAYDSFFSRFVWGTEPLEKPVQEALNYVGLQINFDNSEKAWEKQFGFKVKEENNTFKVAQIAPDSPAERSGLSVEDELVALNGVKLTQNLADLFDYHYGETIQLTIFRNNHLQQIHLKANSKQFFPDAKLAKQEAPSEDQKQNFEAWAWVNF